jgi:hypothetical protein
MSASASRRSVYSKFYQVANAVVVRTLERWGLQLVRLDFTGRHYTEGQVADQINIQSCWLNIQCECVGGGTAGRANLTGRREAKNTRANML